VGNNNFTISFVNSHNIPLGISSATLRYNELEKSIGPITVDVQKISKGIFSAKGAFGIPGLWNLQIEGIPDKQNSTAIASVFNNIRVKPRLEQLQFNITEFNTPSNASQPHYTIKVQILFGWVILLLAAQGH
jgi:copper transport protein